MKDWLQDQQNREVILFILISIYFTVINLYYSKKWDIGLKGRNRSWDSPEITIKLFNYTWPICIFIDFLLDPPGSDMAWIFLILVLAFSLLGRVGFEAVIGWRTKIMGGSTEIKTETNTKTEAKVDKPRDEEPPEVSN